MTPWVYIVAFLRGASRRNVVSVSSRRTRRRHVPLQIGTRQGGISHKQPLSALSLEPSKPVGTGDDISQLLRCVDGDPSLDLSRTATCSFCLCRLHERPRKRCSTHRLFARDSSAKETHLMNVTSARDVQLSLVRNRSNGFSFGFRYNACIRMEIQTTSPVVPIRTGSKRS